MISIDAIIEIYGLREGLTIVGDEVVEWPYEEDKPTTEELLSLSARYSAKVAYMQRRKSEYPSLDNMLVALIEKEEGRPEALNALMLQRLQVKNKYPKPE